MSKTIKLIWDFFGPDARQTARHHALHLKEFSEREQLLLNECGVEETKMGHSLAFLLVDESEMIKVRDALKPNRGVLHEPK